MKQLTNDLVHRLEYQHIIPERKAFGKRRYGQAVVADLFNVHNHNNRIRRYNNLVNSILPTLIGLN